LTASFKVWCTHSESVRINKEKFTMRRLPVTYLLQAAILVALVFLSVQLFGIRAEPQNIRREQLKNRLYSVPAEVMGEFKEEERKLLESSGLVNSSGPLQVTASLPLEVTLEDQPIRVEIEP
jgi:hypothetical protein